MQTQTTNANAAVEKLCRMNKQGKFLCVGLDTDFKKLPEHIGKLHKDHPTIGMFEFNKAIIEATKNVAAAYKINYSFYEEYGSRGIKALEDTCEHLHRAAPDVFLILDRKVGDIDNSNIGTAHLAFGLLRCDAITLAPYMGGKSLELAFLSRKDKLFFILACTSNEGAGEFQDMKVVTSDHGDCDLYSQVANNVNLFWNGNNNCGLVTGATYPEKIKNVRSWVPFLPFLIPGIGKQGGDLEAALDAAFTVSGTGVLVNLSRSIIFASNGKDFAEAAGRVAEEQHHLMHKYWKEKFAVTAQ